MFTGFPATGIQVVPLMDANTKLLQAMADALCKDLFDGMPSVRLFVKSDPHFDTRPNTLAVYRYPYILVRPDHPQKASFTEITNTVAHELIHAWEKWKGIKGMGEMLDEGHSEWFVKKALEINKKNTGVIVDVEYLLTNPKAVHIYNRVAGIWIAPHLRDEETVVIPKPKPVPIPQVTVVPVIPVVTQEPTKDKFDFNDALGKYVVMPLFVFVVLYVLIFNVFTDWQSYFLGKLIPWVVILWIASFLIWGVRDLWERWDEKQKTKKEPVLVDEDPLGIRDK
jgi:hypothetical protein